MLFLHQILKFRKLFFGKKWCKKSKKLEYNAASGPLKTVSVTKSRISEPKNWGPLDNSDPSNCLRDQDECNQGCPCHDNCMIGCPCDTFDCDAPLPCEETYEAEIRQCWSDCNEAVLKGIQDCTNACTDPDCMNSCYNIGDELTNCMDTCPCAEDCHDGCPCEKTCQNIPDTVFKMRENFFSQFLNFQYFKFLNVRFLKFLTVQFF